MSFIQYQLWTDCSQNCTFCSSGVKPHTEVADKISRINTVIESIKNINYADKIGFIGGEFFDGNQIDGVSNWKKLLLEASKKCKTLLLTATLILPYAKNKCLQDTISFLLQNKINFLLCTSYDSVGRFKNDSQFNSWLENVNILHSMSIDLMCTCIPTCHLLQDKRFDLLPEFLKINLSELHPQIQFFIKNKDNKDNYHTLVIQDKFLEGLLPKRKDFLAWIVNHKSILSNYIHFNDLHAENIYIFDNSNELKEAFLNTFDNTSILVNPKCGHQLYSMGYKDSPNCMVCDCINFT